MLTLLLPLAQATLLVFDGIKMGANITLNGQPVGTAVDQFLRYQFDVTKLLKSGTNELSVTFDFEIDVGGRYMACTGGILRNNMPTVRVLIHTCCLVRLGLGPVL